MLFIIALIVITALPSAAQKEKKYTRQGNRDYSDNKFEESEILYRRAIDVDPSYNKAVFNLGDALYKQEKYEEAVDRFEELSQKELEKEQLSGSYYNLGNSLLKSGKIEESIEAYKNALRNNPDNMEAKYNLAYAQDLLQQQQQQQQNKDQQQDQNQDKQNDQQSGSEENNEQQEEQDRQQDQGQENQQQEDQDDNQQQQQQMSKEDAERLLQALAENEKEVQEKVKEAKAARARVRTLKNW
ncbi:MAG: tetratricopeptide repeat protein [Bacteroidales bacterium]|nr:tetratricopeptide repeat protein [Bacteroidales bacterium]